MREIPLAGGCLHKTVLQQGIVTGVGSDGKSLFLPVQTCIRLVGALDSIGVLSLHRR